MFGGRREELMNEEGRSDSGATDVGKVLLNVKRGRKRRERRETVLNRDASVSLQEMSVKEETAWP